MAEHRVRARDIERRCEAVNQQVARLVRLDQPELHPVRARVEIENPSAEFCLTADLCLAVEVRLAVDFHRRFEAHRGSPNISPAAARRVRARPAAFPDRARWRAESLPWGCRSPDRWPPACTTVRGETGGRNIPGPRGAARGGTSTTSRWSRRSVAGM